MIKRLNLKAISIFAFVLICFVPLCAQAQLDEGEPVSSIGGTAEIRGALLAPQSSSTSTYVRADEYNQKLTNVITFKIDEGLQVYFASGFNATITFTIEGEDILGNTLQPVSGVQLSVNYDNSTGAKYKAFDYKVFENYAKCKVTVTNFSLNGNSGWDPKDVLVLVNEIRALRYFNMSPDPVDLTPVFYTNTVQANADENLLEWYFPQTTHESMSQLEWSFVEEDMLPFYNNDYNLLFQTNSTRVDVPTGSKFKKYTYKIPLLYPGPGKLFYRIRAVKRKTNGTLICGPWTVVNSGTGVINFPGHEVGITGQTRMNWQSSITFAEEGKYKSVIQYYDGSLRPRQTVTKDNSTSTPNVVVGETIYDLQGRPNIQILPTPIKQSVIKYFDNINKFNAYQQSYDNPAKYFDLATTNFCAASPALENTSGTAQYYSSNNEWLSTESKSKFIPDAQGFAYTETRYSDDATQRVVQQSGVGAQHRIGSGKETKYYYGKPAQAELDALFGTEVGDAGHYFKNMVSDANGQLSVSYIDMHGRTIATALAGAMPQDTMSNISNAQDYPLASGDIREYLSTPTTNIIQGKTIVSSSTLLSTSNTQYKFVYQLQPDILQLSKCNGASLCYDCKYNLEISIKGEECGSNVNYLYRYNNLQLVPEYNACTTSMGFTGDGIPTPTYQINLPLLTLPPGSYSIRKSLSLDDSSFNARREEALSLLLCKTKETLYQTIYDSLVATSGCGQTTTQACQACNDSLGTYTTFKIKYLNSYYPVVPPENEIQDAYNQAKQQCNILCGAAVNPEFSTIKNMRNQMLADMVPFTGQYALETEAGTVSKRFNIFSTTTGYFTQPYYKNPKTETNQSFYIDENGQQDPDLYNNGVSLSSMPPSEFTAMFKQSWAASLIKYHPEYPKLLYAETPDIKNCYDWMDKAFVSPYSIDSPYIQPVSANSANDPYFSLSGTSAELSEIYQKINSHLDPSNTSSPSVWQIANASYLCATVPDAPAATKLQCIKSLRADGMDPNVPVDKRNDVWDRFKSVYFSIRNGYLLNRIQNNQITTGGLIALSQADMNTLTINEEKELIFAKPQDIANQNGWTWWSGVTNPNGIDTTQISPYLAANTTSMCNAMRPYWKAKLLQCDSLAYLANNNPTTYNTIINQILDGLVSVCSHSQNAQQPYGASNVEPGYNGTPQNFEQVVNTVLNNNGIQTGTTRNLFCNPFTIDFPKPYGQNPPVFTTYTNTIDSCACKRFSSLKNEAATLGFNTLSLSSFNQFLLQNYNDSLSLTLWNGLKNCNSMYVDTCFREGKQAVSKIASKVSFCPKPVISTLSFANGNLTVSGYFLGSGYCGSPAVCIYNSSNVLLQTYNFACGTGSSDAELAFSINVGAYDSCGFYKVVVKSTYGTCGTVTSDTAYRNGCPPPCPTIAPIITSVAAVSSGGVPSLQVNYTLSTNCNTSAIYLETNTGSFIASSIITCSSTSYIFQGVDTCKLYRIYIRSYRTGCDTLTGNIYDYRCGTIPPCYKYTPILLLEPVVMPPVLTCGYVKPCLSCTKLVNELTPQFRSLFPQFSGVPYLSSITTDEQQAQNSLWARFINYRTGFSKNALDYMRAYQSCTGGTPPVNAICAFDPPANSPADIYPGGGNPCQLVSEQALYMATLMIEKQKDSLLARFDSLYLQKCISSAVNNETFYVEYKPMEYHYTLYYYDQAGNLVKTLPPAAVRPNYSAAYLQAVNNARIAGIDYYNTDNNEALATNYRYNTLNQVVAQKTPDAGTSRFWYDKLGRLAISQNAKQAAQNKYSYTIYDELGRITQVGQKPQTTPMTQAISQNVTALADWLRNSSYAINPGTVTGGLKEQITRTVYDKTYYDGDNILATTYPVGSNPILIQKNLRNRVSYTQLINLEPTNYETVQNPYAGVHSAATFYSYDIHGNVDELVQDFGSSTVAPNDMNANNKNRFKKMRYTYDLISGKVNTVVYQPGMMDEYTHAYTYDAENRLTGVKTSHDGILWETDAAYEYYRHGPLSKTTLGQNKVQGLDYAYTLQGWLKGVNSTAAVAEFDMGADGYNSISVARDAFGFSLNYYTNDYIKIGAAAPEPFVSIPALLPQANDLLWLGTNLYNGNIRAMLVNIPKLGDARLYGYKYDQLNRITGMDVYTGLGNSTNQFAGGMPTGSTQYRERITYDPNGNIRTYVRNGANAQGMPLVMDNLTYGYNFASGKLQNNKLRHVKDAIGDANYTEDIDNQPDDNFDYDAIGNLIKDTKEGITAIDWNVYGKISSITKNGAQIIYTYDAVGNRISKSYNGVKTYYVRDASGNVMSIYTKDASINGGNLSQTEIPMYGSSRLGVWNTARDVSNLSEKNFSNYLGNFIRGNKFFELTNHLGNVLVTISDKKIGHDAGNGTIDYYTPDVVTANDYYPFGMQMPGRKYTQPNSKYRFGFNGKEKSDEISGEGNACDFDARMYSPRIGRWFSTDAHPKAFSSPYNYVQNNPVNRIDPDGKDDIHFYFVTTQTSKTYGIGVNQRTLTFTQTASFVYVEKNNSPDRFFHHRVSTNIGRDVVTEFYPFIFNSRSGLTQSYAPFSFGLVSRNDRDVHTLAKYYDASPAFKDYLDKRLTDPRVIHSQNGSDYKNIFFPNREDFNFWGKVSSTSETVANLMMLAKAGFSLMSGAVSSEGQFVYRALRADEAASFKAGTGIGPKNINGTWSLDSHLTKGSSASSWTNDPWVATTSDINIARAFDSGNGIVKIDLSKLARGTQVEQGWLSLPRSSPGYHFSIWQQETSILGRIPQSAITPIK